MAQYDIDAVGEQHNTAFASKAWPDLRLFASCAFPRAEDKRANRRSTSTGAKSIRSASPLQLRKWIG